MKIYTKRGDDGDTEVIGSRIAKSDPRIAAIGALDELNAVLGVLVAEMAPPSIGKGQTESRTRSEWLAELAAALTEIQRDLFGMGAELASATTRQPPRSGLPEGGANRLEQHIDRWDADLPPLKTFVLPGGTRAAAHLHVARTVCRRAERSIVHLARAGDEPVAPHVIVYLNRLSDLLFVAARKMNQTFGVADVPWP